MQVRPVVAQARASAIPAGDVFAAPVASGGSALFIRVAHSEAVLRAAEAADILPGEEDVAVVQLAPRSTELNWLNAIAGDVVVSDVTDAVAAVYDADPSNFRFLSIDNLPTLITGDLIIDGEKTKMVCVGPNPAIGIGFIDLVTGELTTSLGPAPMLVVSWMLDTAAG